MRRAQSLLWMACCFVAASSALVAVAQPEAATAPPGELSDPSWGFRFTVPDGWKQQSSYQGALLTHDQTGAVILVWWHPHTTLQQVAEQGYQAARHGAVTLYPKGQMQAFGENAVTCDYEGIAEGVHVRAVGYGTLSPHGGGACVLAGGPTEVLTDGLRATAAGIVNSQQYFKVSATELMRHFCGTWNGMDQYTDATIVLAPDGSYYDSRTTTVTGIFRDVWTDRPDGSWGSSGSTAASGKWTVRGSPAQGQFEVTQTNGQKFTVDYNVHVEYGRPLWHVYRFNGMLYQKK